MEDEANLFLDGIKGSDTSTPWTCSISQDDYGDYITYPDGSVEYINIGD